MQRAESEKPLMLGKIGEKGTTEDKTVGWHHRLSGHEFEQTLGDGEGQGSLARCSPWGRKALDITERLNKVPYNRKKKKSSKLFLLVAAPSGYSWNY